MTVQGWMLILVFLILLVALAKPMGSWLFAVYEGRRTPLHVVLGPVERDVQPVSYTHLTLPTKA